MRDYVHYGRVLDDLRICQDRQHVTKVISTLHTLLDEDCVENNCASTTNAAIDILLDADQILLSMKVSCDPQVLMLVWKRLIAFFKSFHGFILSDRSTSLVATLNSRALHFINKLCLEEKAKESELQNQEARDNKYGYLLSHLHFLAFYCQRISASMAYFPSHIPQSSFKTSTEILLCLRGFLSTLEKTYPQLDVADLTIKSEEYFRKSMRSPPVLLEKNQSQLQMELDITDPLVINKITPSKNDNLNRETSSYQKFYRSIKCNTYSVCLIENNSMISKAAYLGYVISTGLSLTMSYEIEKINVPQLMMLLLSNAQRTSDKLSESVDYYLEPVKITMSIFLFSMEKICVAHNCYGSDEFIIKSINRFVTAYVSILNSVHTEGLHESLVGTASNILTVGTFFKCIIDK